jgi:hypothetical protein
MPNAKRTLRETTRWNRRQHVEDLAKYAGVPVPNDLTDEYYPTGMVADVMTMREHSDKPLHQIMCPTSATPRSMPREVVTSVCWFFGPKAPATSWLRVTVDIAPFLLPMSTGTEAFCFNDACGIGNGKVNRDNCSASIRTGTDLMTKFSVVTQLRIADNESAILS